MARSTLHEFTEVLADFRQLGSLALKGAVAVPLADTWLKLGPPPTSAIAVLTSLMEFISVIWVFHFWQASKERQLGKRMKVALGGFAVGLVCSLALMWQFTVLPGHGRERVIVGFQLRQDVKPVLSPQYAPYDALRDNEYDPDKVWTRESITILRTLITVIWIFTFTSLAVYLTAFIMLQRCRYRLQTPTSNQAS